MRRSAVLLLVGLVLLSGCGGTKHATTTPSAGTSSPTASAPSTPLPTAVVSAGSNPGLPTDFPTTVVPIVPGNVALPVGQGGGTEGRKGWVLELKLDQATGACFDAAAKTLTDHGFTKQPGETSGNGLREAQFIATGYAVILSASRTTDGKCRLGYEVGQVGG